MRMEGRDRDGLGMETAYISMLCAAATPCLESLHHCTRNAKAKLVPVCNEAACRVFFRNFSHGRKKTNDLIWLHKSCVTQPALGYMC
jgi:hypothetical protein